VCGSFHSPGFSSIEIWKPLETREEDCRFALQLLLEFLNYLHQDILESVIGIRDLSGRADGRVVCHTLTELGHEKNGVVSSQVAEGYVVKLSPVSHLVVKHGFSSASPESVSRYIVSTGEAVVVVDSRHCLF